MEMEGEIMNLGRVWIAIIASFCYCYFISSKLPKGKWRLISLLPIFYIFTILPFYLSSAFFAGVTAGGFTWIANFKLLLFAFNQGPFSSKPQISLPMFVLMAVVGFKMKPISDGPRRSKKLPLNLATEIPIFAVIQSISHNYREYIHPCILLVAYCCLAFLALEISFELSNLLARALLGLALEPISDEPYLSTSLQDFWGRRWNLLVSDLLRQTIYKPIRSAGTGPLGRDRAAVAGVLATFLVSGLMHELVLWYVVRGKPSWEMTMFFVVHGVCVAMEIRVKVALTEKKWRLPGYVSWMLTVGFVMGTSYWLFFPPLMRSGADVRTVEEFRYVGVVVKEKMMEFWVHKGRSNMEV